MHAFSQKPKSATFMMQTKNEKPTKFWVFFFWRTNNRPCNGENMQKKYIELLTESLRVPGLGFWFWQFRNQRSNYDRLTQTVGMWWPADDRHKKLAWLPGSCSATAFSRLRRCSHCRLLTTTPHRVSVALY